MYNIIKNQSKYIANNYKPLDIVFKSANNIYLYDIDNNKYFDCLSGYSSLNQGHCHPKIYKEIKKQARNLTLTSRALYNNKIGDFSEKICKMLDYEKILMMNTGVEGGETATKIARVWGYKEKKVTYNEAVNLFCKNNFWGRTLAACSSSDDPSCYENFGPYQEGFELVDFNNLEILEQKFKENPNIVSFMFEPIQGEAGVIVPDNGYLKGVRELCTKYNVLMIADEVQTGLCRTGKMLACDYEDVKPDLLILGKALSGGYYPISGVLGNDNIMNAIDPGTHGSTYGGNPLACAIASSALDVLIDENLATNSYTKGVTFRMEINKMKKGYIKEIRGKGLLNAIECVDDIYAQKLHDELLKNKVIVKVAHGNKLRINPPLIITDTQMSKLLDKFEKSINKI